MDRMKTVLLFFLCWIGLSSPVKADERWYLPEYEASPAAGVEANLKVGPTPAAVVAIGEQPEVSCNLRVIQPPDIQAPMEIKLSVTGKIDGKELSQFRYLFGDGESATGSGEMKYIYTKPGTYQLRVTPVVTGDVELPICKSKIVVKTGTETETELVVEATMAAEASVAAELIVQPKTGPSLGYWASMVGLFIVWMGTIKWYRSHQQQIG